MAHINVPDSTYIWRNLRNKEKEIYENQILRLISMYLNALYW